VMSSFELRETGGGNFELVGDMSFETANEILKSSERLFAQHALVQVDLGQVSKADSAGLALLLEWKAQAGQRAATISFTGLPDSLIAIAKTSEVSGLI